MQYTFKYYHSGNRVTRLPNLVRNTVLFCLTFDFVSLGETNSENCSWWDCNPMSNPYNVNTEIGTRDILGDTFTFGTSFFFIVVVMSMVVSLLTINLEPLEMERRFKSWLNQHRFYHRSIRRVTWDHPVNLRRVG